MSVTAAVPAHLSPVIADYFSSQSFTNGHLPNLALAANPADGFSPTRLANGTEVVFVPKPDLLPAVFRDTLTPLWENGLGLVLFRHVDTQVVGAIFVHGAIRNPWNAILPGVFQCLGGVMLFSDAASEAKSDLTLLGDVIRKSTAMTTKWQFIDQNLANTGHTTLTQLGGGKSTASHPDGAKGRRDAVMVTASVAHELGIYISGSDQNMDTSLCTYFAEQAPLSFMGAQNHPTKGYGGMGDPSPWTARGVVEALKKSAALMFGAQKPPVFFQGYGNVGAPVVTFAAEAGFPVSGIIDINVERLEQARKAGFTAPLFLQIDPKATPSEEVLSRANALNATFVPDLATALRGAPDTVIFSPNAGPHPITSELADFLVASEIRTIVGAANNVFDTVDGSIRTLAERLQARGIFIPNDSETNQMGALSVTVDRIGLNEDGLMRAAIGVASLTELAYAAYRSGVPPQIARDEAAKRRFNRLVEEGAAVGGPFPGVEKTPEVTT